MTKQRLFVAAMAVWLVVATGITLSDYSDIVTLYPEAAGLGLFAIIWLPTALLVGIGVALLAFVAGLFMPPEQPDDEGN